MPKKESKKADPTVVVAIIGLIGTLVAALLASPLLPKLLGSDEDAAATEVPPVVVTVISTGETPLVRRENLVFSNDFQDGNASGFAFNSDAWEVKKEKNNPALEMNGLGADSEVAVFGPNDFSDGYIRFRINYRNFDGFQLRFRTDAKDETYALFMDTLGGAVILGYGDAANGWELIALDNGSRPFAFNEDVWYDVKLEVTGEQMTVWVDGNKLLTSSDPRLQKGGMKFAVQGNGTVWIDDVEVWQYTYEPQ